MDELKVRVSLGSLLISAGLVSTAEQSVVLVKRTLPIPVIEPVAGPRRFQVIRGASSSYCPKKSCAFNVAGNKMNRVIIVIASFRRK